MTPLQEALWPDPQHWHQPLRPWSAHGLGVECGLHWIQSQRGHGFVQGELSFERILRSFTRFFPAFWCWRRGEAFLWVCWLPSVSLSKVGFTKTKKSSWIFDVSRYAKSFGSDNSVWIQEFSRVYYKMLMNGYSKLKKVRWFEMWNTSRIFIIKM